MFAEHYTACSSKDWESFDQIKYLFFFLISWYLTTWSIRNYMCQILSNNPCLYACSLTHILFHNGTLLLLKLLYCMLSVLVLIYLFLDLFI